jgi:hypothetical protein
VLQQARADAPGADEVRLVCASNHS